MKRLLLVLVAFAVVPAVSAEGAPAFSQYPATVTSDAKVTAIDLSSSPQARLFKTNAQQTVGQKANFAGHYVLITQGCGSPCTAIALVDVQTGKVYPASFSAALGVSFRVDSRMIVENPPEDIKDYYGGALPVDFPRLFYSTYYEWNERTKTFIKIFDDYPKTGAQQTSPSDASR